MVQGLLHSLNNSLPPGLIDQGQLVGLKQPVSLKVLSLAARYRTVTHTVRGWVENNAKLDTARQEFGPFGFLASQSASQSNRTGTAADFEVAVAEIHFFRGWSLPSVVDLLEQASQS